MSWKIGGAGVAGSYLFGRMKASGFDVEIYDPKRPNFYIPCGFATNRNSIDPYLKKLSISFDEIAEADTGRIWFSGNNFEKTEFLQNGLSTINKMKMELLMRGGMPYQRGMINDRNSFILDCTGISRAYLGKVQSDQTMFAIEKVCKSSPYDGFYFNFFRIEGKKEFITWFLNNVMDVEAIEQLKADKYERNDNRAGYRNGYKKRRLKTVDGELLLDKPDIRNIID